MTDLRQALEDARRALLDLSTRNRLLSLPKPGRSRGVVILDDEDADFVIGALAAGRAFGFEAAGEEAPEAPVEGEAPAPGTEIVAAGKPVGTLYSVAEGRGLAHLRFDRAEGELAAGGARVTWRRD